MDNNEKVDNKTANRILLAGAVVFIVFVICPFLIEALGTEELGMNIRFYFGFPIAAAYFADKIYMSYLRKQQS